MKNINLIFEIKYHSEKISNLLIIGIGYASLTTTLQAYIFKKGYLRLTTPLLAYVFQEGYLREIIYSELYFYETN